MFNVLTYYLSWAQMCMMDSSVLTNPAKCPVHAFTISFPAGPSQKDCGWQGLTITGHFQPLIGVTTESWCYNQRVLKLQLWFAFAMSGWTSVTFQMSFRNERNRTLNLWWIWWEELHTKLKDKLSILFWVKVIFDNLLKIRWISLICWKYTGQINTDTLQSQAVGLHARTSLSW